MRYLTPVPKQFVDHSGIPYSDGTVSVYLSGDSELADIYEDAEGDALYPNPCKLDANGAWQCFVPGGVPLDYIVKDRNGNVVFEFYDILPSGGDGAVYNILGVEGETVVTKRSNAEGNITATVGLDPEFKQRVTDAENDIGDLNERVNGVEGSIDDLARDLGEVDDKVDDVAVDVEGLHTSLNNKKDRQAPYSLNDIPPDRTVKSVTQDANGRMQVETQPIQFPGHDQVGIESPEGTLEIQKSYSEGRQDFDMDVADHSLDTDKMKVNQFKYLDADGVTIKAEVDGHTIVLSALEVLVTTSTTYESVVAIIANGKHPVLSSGGHFYRLACTSAGSTVGGVASIAYNFTCVSPSGQDFSAENYNLDVTNGWTTTSEPLARKASSGSGQLAAIDSNGNYAGSGISAYDQAMINGLINNSIQPAVAAAAKTITKPFTINYSGSTVSGVLDFRNSYVGQNVIRIGIELNLSGDDMQLKLYLPWENEDWNGWIRDTEQEPAGNVGYSRIHDTRCNITQATTTVTETDAEMTIPRADVSQTSIAFLAINTSSLYDSSGRHMVDGMIGNSESGKFVQFHIDLAYTTDVANNRASVFGSATCFSESFE